MLRDILREFKGIQGNGRPSNSVASLRVGGFIWGESKGCLIEVPEFN